MAKLSHAEISHQSVGSLEKTEQYKSTRDLLHDGSLTCDQNGLGKTNEGSQLLFTIPVLRGSILGVEVWSNRITIPPTKKRKCKILHKEFIYAFHMSSKAQNGIEIVTYEDEKTKKKRRLYELIVQSGDDKQSPDDAKCYVTKLREWLWETSIDAQNLMEQFWKYYLVVVNPYSGVQKGKKRFLNVVQPIMEECRIKYDVIFTERSLQGMEIGQTTPPNKYDAIIGMSGDGLINEILNGMINRPDKEEALKTPFGVIANGTSNCLAAEVMDTYGDTSVKNAVLNSTLHVIKGKPRRFNLMRTQLQNDKSVFHGFNLISWGLLANVEFESIPLRKLGSLRYFVYVMKHLVLKKKFRGEIWINLVPRSQWNEEYTEYFDNCSSRSRDKEFVTSVQNNISQSSLSSGQPIKIEDELPENSTWVKIPSTEFLLVSFTNTRRWGLDLWGCKFLQHEDPFGYLILVRHPIRRLDFFRVFLNLEEGNHQKFDVVEIYCIKGLRVKPDAGSDALTFISLDGEQQNSQKYQIDVVPGAISVLF